MGTQLSLACHIDCPSLWKTARRGLGWEPRGGHLSLWALTVSLCGCLMAPPELGGHGSERPLVPCAGSLQARAVAALTATKHEGGTPASGQTSGHKETQLVWDIAANSCVFGVQASAHHTDPQDVGAGRATHAVLILARTFISSVSLWPDNRTVSGVGG